MFSGIVQRVGIVEEVQERGGGKELVVNPSLKREWKEGESVLVSGICSTITRTADGLFAVFYMPETLRKTTTDSWEQGTRVNIEPSLRLGDELGGHFVFGHVDGRARVERIEEQGESRLVALRVPDGFASLLAEKGSVALDGVSLTVVEPTDSGFTVSLIPYTLECTTLGQLKEGDELNIELDMLAKYVARLLGNK